MSKANPELVPAAASFHVWEGAAKGFQAGAARVIETETYNEQTVSYMEKDSSREGERNVENFDK